jgi:hypothetical protein
VEAILLDFQILIQRIEAIGCIVLRGPRSFDSTVGTKPALEAQLESVAFDGWNGSPDILI